MNPRFGLSDKIWTCGLYHPKKLNYLFLAVFAFFSPFCYAKTAFSYSPDILSPCTPVLFMVKDVVKSEYRMIDMWSWFWGGRSARNLLRRQRMIAPRTEKEHANQHMWSNSYREMINMWSERSATQSREVKWFVLLLQVLYCNSREGLCQAPFTIKSEFKIWYAVSKEKARRDHFQHVWANPLVHTWWIWSHFAFRSINTHIRTQKLICSKQRKGFWSSNHIGELIYWCLYQWRETQICGFWKN